VTQDPVDHRPLVDRRDGENDRIAHRMISPTPAGSKN
jgi:hypothetical protein